jgi:hypothetical protein
VEGGAPDQAEKQSACARTANHVIASFNSSSPETHPLTMPSVSIIGVLLIYLTSCQAFLFPVNVSTRHRRIWNPTHQPNKSQINAGLFGPKEASETNDVTAPKRVIEIPVTSVKKGGLRMVLGLCLIGLQNTPDPGSWRANQASDTVLDMIFKDNAAKFSVVFEDSCIAVDRYGQASLPYLLQESVILHKVLDELNELAFTNEVEAENRLFQLEDSTLIEQARSTLPARQA